MILICLSKRAPSEQVAIESYKVYCDLKKAPHLDVEYAHHASGAPYFKGDETTFISLSHSGEWVSFKRMTRFWTMWSCWTCMFYFLISGLKQISHLLYDIDNKTQTFYLICNVF